MNTPPMHPPLSIEREISSPPRESTLEIAEGRAIVGLGDARPLMESSPEAVDIGSTWNR